MTHQPTQYLFSQHCHAVHPSCCIFYCVWKLMSGQFWCTVNMKPLKVLHNKLLTVLCFLFQLKVLLCFAALWLSLKNISQQSAAGIKYIVKLCLWWRVYKRTYCMKHLLWICVTHKKCNSGTVCFHQNRKREKCWN